MSNVLRMPPAPSRYQYAKAKLLAAELIRGVCESNYVTLADLPVLMANLSEADWRAISFAAGVPVADKPARILAIAIVQGVLA